jgi:hypothetical protein
VNGRREAEGLIRCTTCDVAERISGVPEQRRRQIDEFVQQHSRGRGCDDPELSFGASPSS